jgi:murein DD-endopeptidase MepM/ murein hydrolase activator NlpD
MALINFYKKLKSLNRGNILIIDFLKTQQFKKKIVLLMSIILSVAIYAFFSTQVNSYKEAKEKNFLNFLNSKTYLNLNKYFLDKMNSPYVSYKYKIKNNDSIEKILTSYAVQTKEIKYIVNDFKTKKLSNIYAGREISIVLKKLEDNQNSIVNLILPINNTLSIEVRKNGDVFTIKENIIKLIRTEVVIKNTIKNNLYSSAIKAGIEPNIIVEFARIYGFEIDFQRDIRKDDWFEIYYERFVDDNGVVKDTGKIIYASMHVNNRDINLYNFNEKNSVGYYDLNGKSIVKSLMKTPINGARLSSSFGNRKHPILGYTKLHTGTDFAARSGTPIMASGSGTVTRARWCGGGGNCIKIKHNSTYQTVYAHMKNFAKGIKEGKKVRQGQVIGYVGSTGMSTGPHLHYEVIVNGKKVNSQKLKLPSGKILKGEERKIFEIARIKIDLKLDELRNF